MMNFESKNKLLSIVTIEKNMKSLLFTLFAVILWAGVVCGQSAAVTFTNPSCNGFTNGTARVTAVGGREPYTYRWSNNQSGQTTSGLAAGTYTVTVTDANGVTTTAVATLVQPPALTSVINATASNCGTTLSPISAAPGGGVPPYIYRWSTGASTQTITPTESNNYFVTVIDANGCPSVATRVVGPVSSFLATATATAPVCAGGTGSVNAAVFGTYPPFTVRWSNGATTQQVQNLAPGTYTVIITDAQNCTTTRTAVVSPSTGVTATVKATDTRCFHSFDGVLAVDARNGVAPYRYQWQDGNGEALRTNVRPGTYTVTVTDNNGCTTTTTATIKEPDSIRYNIAVTAAACGSNGSATASTIGGTPPFRYVWSGIPGGPVLNNAAPGQYYLCVFDANNCQKDIVFTIPGTPGFKVDLDVTKPSCASLNNGAVNVKVTPATGNYRYQWSNGTSGTKIENLAPGAMLGVTVTDLNTNCTVAAGAVITSAGEVSLTTSKTDATCTTRGTVTGLGANGTAPYTYRWVGPDGVERFGATLNGLNAGTYSVTVIDVRGCTATNSAVVAATQTSSANIALTTTNAFCAGSASGSVTANVTPSGTYTYLWNNAATTSSLTNVAAGTYTVTVTDANGCTRTATAVVNASPALVVQVNTTNASCTTGTGSTSILVTGGRTPYTFRWNTPTPPLTPGTYTVTVTDANGCTGTGVATINPPSNDNLNITITSTPVGGGGTGGNNATCSNAPVRLTAVGGTINMNYTWTPGTGVTPTNDPRSVIVNPGATTTYTVKVQEGTCSKDVSTVVTRIPAPDLVPVGNTAVSTCENQAALTVRFATGSGNVTWLGPTGQQVGTGLTFNAPATGNTQTYRAVTGEACRDTVAFTVQSGALNVNIVNNGPLSVCSNVNTNLEARAETNQPVTWEWRGSSPFVGITNSNSATPRISVNTPGAYTVTVTARSGGCSATRTIAINVRQSTPIDAAVTSDPCGGLTINFRNNTPGVTGIWTFGENQSTETINQGSYRYRTPGTYTVTFTPNNTATTCFAAFTRTVTVSSQSAVALDIAGAQTNCDGNATFRFTDRATNSTPVTSWQWSFTPGNQTSTQQNPTMTFTQEGRIRAILTATNAAGCVGRDTIDVDPVFVNDPVDAQARFCPGERVALNPVNNTTYTYRWASNPGDPNLAPTSPNPTVAPTAATTYTVTITNRTCTVTRTVQVTPSPAATLVASNDTTVCNNNPLTLGIVRTDGASFEWSTTRNFATILGTGRTVSVTPQGTSVYHVRTRNAGGCAGSDSVVVNNGTLRLDISPLQRNVCLGNETALTITNLVPTQAVRYAWTGGLLGINNPVVRPTASTTYSVTVSNQLNCTATLAFNLNVIDMKAQARVVGKDSICPGESTQLQVTATGSTNYTYQWSPANSLSSGNIANPMATPTETTTYAVTVSDANRCTATAAGLRVFFINPECREPFIFIPKAFTPNNDDKNDSFRVRGVNITEVYFVVYNRWGERVYETRDVEHLGWDGSFRGKEATPDSYAWYVRAVCRGGEVFERKGDVTLLK
jgi:gliding motility-associated-like protein